MQDTQRILIAVDDSEATTKAVTYVGTLLAGHHQVNICLLHALAAPPQEFLAVGGGESPEDADAAEPDPQAQWLAAVEAAAAPIFDKAQALLRQAGMATGAIETQIATAGAWQDIVTDILEAARTHACGTIVVGRESFSPLRALFQNHVADVLLRHAQGFTVWVVA